MSRHERVPWDEMLVVGAWLAFAAASVWATSWDGYYLGRELLVCQISGYMALGFLAASLLARPWFRIATWLGRPVDGSLTSRFSRNTGIASGLAAILHAGLATLLYLDSQWLVPLTLPYLQSGVLALTVFLLLLLASIKPLMKRLRWHLWTPLYRLSFLAALLVLHHMLYAPFASRSWTLSLYAAGLAITGLRWIPSRTVQPTSERPTGR